MLETSKALSTNKFCAKREARLFLGENLKDETMNNQQETKEYYKIF